MAATSSNGAYSLAAAYHLRTLIRNVHLLVGLTAGTFMVILGVTGSIMEFEPELDRISHPHLSYVTPDARILPLSEIGAAVSRRFNGEPVVAFIPSTSPQLSSQVLLQSGIAYVNQHTGEILGERTRGQTFLGYVRSLHVRLASGDFGRTVLKWSAAGMLVSLMSGLYLWWPLKRIRIRGKGASRRLWFDLHNSIGFLSLLPLALLAATGAILGFEGQMAPVIYRVTGSQPTQVQPWQVHKPTANARMLTPDEAVAIARPYMAGAAVYRVQMPEYGGVYQIALLYSSDQAAGDRNLVVVDPYDGSILSISRSSQLSRGDRALATNEAIHIGSIWGMPSRILAWIASMIVPLQVLSGVILWLQRKRFFQHAKAPSNEGTRS